MLRGNAATGPSGRAAIDATMAAASRVIGGVGGGLDGAIEVGAPVVGDADVTAVDGAAPWLTWRPVAPPEPHATASNDATAPMQTVRAVRVTCDLIASSIDGRARVVKIRPCRIVSSLPWQGRYPGHGQG